MYMWNSVLKALWPYRGEVQACELHLWTLQVTHNLPILLKSASLKNKKYIAF